MSTSTTQTPPELITEILIRLPVKHLLRFRCVSKSWRAQIDGPDFIKLHLAHSLQTSANQALILEDFSYLHLVEDLQLLNLSATILTHPFYLLDQDYSTHVLGSCNGLLAILISLGGIAIWNPYTRKHLILPDLMIKYQPFFRPSFRYGFGYDSLHDDYKLVRMAGPSELGWEVAVYSLNSYSWRRIRDFAYYFVYEGQGGIPANEALHWVVTRNRGDVDYVVVAFDLRKEEYRELGQPDYGKDGGFSMYLGVLGGQLCVVCDDVWREHVGVWVMKEYGVTESWSRLIRVAQTRVICWGPEFVWPLVYSVSGKRVLLKQGANKLVWSDPDNGWVEEVKVRNAPKSFRAWTAVGSLVAVTGGNANGGTESDQESKRIIS